MEQANLVILPKGEIEKKIIESIWDNSRDTFKRGSKEAKVAMELQGKGILSLVFLGPDYITFRLSTSAVNLLYWLAKNNVIGGNYKGGRNAA